MKRKSGSLAKDEIASWFAGKSFSTDWTSWHFPNWTKLLQPYRGRAVSILEIGSWEGRSALFFLNFMPKAKLTCIDTFAGGQEHQEAAARSEEDAETLRTVERRFDSNVKPFRKRVEKLKAQSPVGLGQLGIDSRRFDIAYIDGGHRAIEVYTDAALAWPLMKRRGLVIFDDYQWDEMPKKMDNPKPGIDAFLKGIAGQYRVVYKKYQVAIEKL
jgi:predicted O-methyltransferase YrrM